MINEIVNNGFQSKLNISNTASTGAVSPAASTEATDTAAPSQPKAVDPGALNKAVTKLNDHVQNLQRKLSFSVSAETGRTIIKVYDAETDELIRQIPPEETIKLAESISATTSSLFVKEQA